MTEDGKTLRMPNAIASSELRSIGDSYNGSPALVGQLANNGWEQAGAARAESNRDVVQRQDIGDLVSAVIVDTCSTVDMRTDPSNGNFIPDAVVNVVKTYEKPIPIPVRDYFVRGISNIFVAGATVALGLRRGVQSVIELAGRAQRDKIVDSLSSSYPNINAEGLDTFKNWIQEAQNAPLFPKGLRDVSQAVISFIDTLPTNPNELKVELIRQSDKFFSLTANEARFYIAATVVGVFATLGYFGWNLATYLKRDKYETITKLDKYRKPLKNFIPKQP